jgi:hypothetical protein
MKLPLCSLPSGRWACSPGWWQTNLETLVLVWRICRRFAIFKVGAVAWRYSHLQGYDGSSHHQWIYIMTKRHATIPAPGPKGNKAEGREPEDNGDAKSITTAIHIPERTWKLLRAVAFHRAQDQGGRASVSKLISELVERHRAELEQETQPNR